MIYAVVCLVSFVASGLAFFSGFGLGTVLTPVMAVFFPVQVAVAAAALVHLANNLFKLLLVGRSADKKIVLRFGLPAVVCALLGAWLLTLVSSVPPVASYQFLGHARQITPVKLVIGILIVAFSCLELFPKFQKASVDRKYMALGGALSGFFGGLSGNQGALRTLFLIKAGLGKEAFIGTGVAVAVMVDCGRLIVYGIGFYSAHSAALAGHGGLVASATISAFAGAFLGRQALKKVTLGAVQWTVGILLLFLGAALSAGLL